jgi:hypothetical protein
MAALDAPVQRMFAVARPISLWIHETTHHHRTLLMYAVYMVTKNTFIPCRICQMLVLYPIELAPRVGDQKYFHTL